MVLSVKNGMKDFKIRNVIFATNFEDDSADFINKLKELQDIFDFKLHLLNVVSIINGKKSIAVIEKLAKEFVTKYQLQNYEFHIVEDMTEYSGITDYAKKINGDIIALSTHQHRGLHWLGGISEDLVNYADQPILTFKAK
jgi:nucleotide-binding universal stress UspA family protein